MRQKRAVKACFVTGIKISGFKPLICIHPSANDGKQSANAQRATYTIKGTKKGLRGRRRACVYQKGNNASVPAAAKGMIAMHKEKREVLSIKKLEFVVFITFR